MVEVAIDTLVICTMTALVMLIGKFNGIEPTGDGMRDAMNAFSGFIPFAELPITIAIIVFVFCTLICWFYYGSESLSYLNGKRSRPTVYIIIFTLSCIAGAVMSGGLVWSLSDLAVSLMTILNIAAILCGLPEIKHETDRFFSGRTANEKVSTKAISEKTCGISDSKTA